MNQQLNQKTPLFPNKDTAITHLSPLSLPIKPNDYFLNNYANTKVIGNGTFGRVFSSLNLNSSS